MPYYRAARFGEARHAARVFRQVEDTIYSTPCDLSAYRLLIDQVSHVTVIGRLPPVELDQQLADALSSGELAELPADVLQILLERRRQASRLGSWVEGHVRPVPPKEP